MKKFVFLHGLGQTPDDWDKVLKHLDGIGEFICPDLTKMCGDPADYRDLYRNVSNLCLDLAEDGDLPHIVGLSLGGILGLSFAQEHTDKIGSLAVIGAQYKTPKKLLGFQSFLFKFAPEQAFEDLGFSREDFLSLCNSMAGLDLSYGLENISCPTLIAVGKEDAPNRKAAREMYESITQARYCEIGTADHEVNKDAPERLAKLLRRFYKAENII